MTYQALAFVPTSTDISLHTVARLISEWFPDEIPVKKAQRTVEGSQLTDWIIWLEWPEWKAQIRPATGPAVQKIAARAALVDNSRKDNKVLAGYDHLIAIQGLDDPDMDHFNDYIFMCQALETLPGAILFDPRDNSFI